MEFLELTWSEVLLGAAVVVGATLGGVAVASILLVRLPAAYFCDSCPRDFWGDKYPALRWAGLIVKNVLGVVVVVLGILLSLPGVPGPGIVTILIGIMLLDFPGKRRLERWILNRGRILNAANRLRRRYGKPPLVLEQPVKKPRWSGRYSTTADSR